jgi:hypothetical protein
MANNDASTEDNFLYVFLHGLICLVDLGKPGFMAYLLDVGTEHKYLCGDWLLERDIDLSEGYPKEFELVGVQPGEADPLDPGLNAVIRLSTLPKPDSSVRAVIKLPRPFDIDHFVRGQLQPTALQGDLTRFDSKPVFISGLRVFTYHITSADDVRIVGDDQEPLWVCPDLVPVDDPSAPGTTVNVAVVHIYNEPPLPLTDANQHTLDEFNQSLKFLSATGVTLVNSATLPQSNNQVLAGLLPGETTTLDDRLLDGQKLLAIARQNARNPGSGAGGGGGSQVCTGANGTIFPPG